MSVKELRPSLDPETCAVCGRRLLQGEVVNWYVAPDSSRRPVCELCVGRAERARWVRERDGDPIVPLRPARAARNGVLQRISAFFGARDADQLEEFDGPVEELSDQPARRRERVARREKPAPEPPVVTPESREVRAVPTGPEAQLAQGLELFNQSQFPRIIAGLSRSLGDPQVAAVNDNAGNIDIYVGWDIAWYSYRVDLGDAGDPVEQSGRGNDSVELADRVPEWNAKADDYGRLALVAPGVGGGPRDEPGLDRDATSDGDDAADDDRPPVYGGP